MKLRIMLADDHGVLMSGIELLLAKEKEWEIIGSAYSGEEAIEKASEWKPDLIIMDISMPGMGGIKATDLITTKFPHIKILMLTMYSEEEYFERALKAGASGYLLKKAVGTDLLSAVKTVMSGENYIYPSMASYLLKGFAKQDNGEKEQNGEDKSTLSEREKEVLQFITLGYTYQEISEQLFVSVKTIESHKARISDKLNMKKRSELVRYAVSQGLINLDGA